MGMLFKWLRIPAPLIFVILWMIVLIVLIGVSEGRLAHHCDGSVNMNSWISVNKASYSNSLARSPISFTFLQIHFIKSSVNFGSALPEQVSFRRRTRALREDKNSKEIMNIQLHIICRAQQTSISTYQLRWVKFVLSRIFKQMLFITFVYSSPGPNLWSDIKPSSTEMRLLMESLPRFWPSDFDEKKLYKLLKRGWYSVRASLSGRCDKCCKKQKEIKKIDYRYF